MQKEHTMRNTDAFRAAKAELAALGLSLKVTEHDEYRVNFRGGREGTAYYTNDLPDAVATGRHMAAERDGQASSASTVAAVAELPRASTKTVNLTPTWDEVGNLYRRFAESGERDACRAMHAEVTLAFGMVDVATALANALVDAGNGDRSGVDAALATFRAAREAYQAEGGRARERMRAQSKRS